MLDLNKVIVDLQTGELTEDELINLYEEGYLNNYELNYIYESLDMIAEGFWADRWTDAKLMGRNVSNMLRGEGRLARDTFNAAKTGIGSGASYIGNRLAQGVTSGLNKANKFITAKTAAVGQLAKDLKSQYQATRGTISQAQHQQNVANNLAQRKQANNLANNSPLGRAAADFRSAAKNDGTAFRNAGSTWKSNLRDNQDQYQKELIDNRKNYYNERSQTAQADAEKAAKEAQRRAQIAAQYNAR